MLIFLAVAAPLEMCKKTTLPVKLVGHWYNKPVLLDFAADKDVSATSSPFVMYFNVLKPTHLMTLLELNARRVGLPDLPSENPSSAVRPHDSPHSQSRTTYSETSSKLEVRD